jgi:DNA polymerase-3 subunit alpha
MDSLAVTDHGNLHAAWSFYEHAKSAGVRPILGFEAYLAFGPRQAREKPQGAPAQYSHLVLLARNKTGYGNLIKLSSIGYLEGYYRRPRIDLEALEQHSEGLVGLAACLSGEIALWLRQGNYDEARQSAERFAKLFGPDGFWLEVQDHGLADEKVVQEGMFRLADDLGLPVVATNDAHYLERADHEAHDCLLAIGTGKDLDDPNRFRFYGQESYLKTEAEMAELFPGRPDVLENTQRVADLCEFDFEKKYFLPEFPLPEDVESDNDLLVRLATEGARRRYGDELPAEVEERLSYELGVITRCGYASYFLIVHDFIQAAKQRGIPVGPGRGSAAGSVVAYGLEITNVDPLQFDLLFERFLNPERISMPDIDVDFCFERRSEVIDYVRQRYGHNSVGQIITFGTLKARAAVRDIARVLRVSPADADRIAKLIPSGPGFAMSVADAVKKVPELAHLVREDATIERLADLAQRIEGLSRHASVHAAGIVIAPGPLDEYVPVCTPPQQRNTNGDGEDAIITQFDMIALEKVGMLKMDFLGLRTLTVIHDAVEMIEQRHGVELDIDAVDLDDPDTYAMLREGRTAGVFQFESPLATEMLYQMRVDRFDDLVATNALVRPGPLDSGMHQVYTRRKRGEEEVRYPHPDLREVLEPTYGVIIYQEQVMRIANILAGYSLAEADVLRKAVGKKIQELIEAELDSFVERAVERGYKRHLIEDIAGQIQTFGRYGFNKSHSVAYSIISFQTAWLKAHYPGEFMAALLSSEIGDTDKVVAYINEAREMGIEVLPPSVNESGWKFTVVGDGQLRFGLGAVRNVGRGAIESIIGGREEGGPYTSLTEFCERVDLRLCNKRVVDSLISAGALDQADTHRAQLSAALDQALSEAQLRQADRASGQASLFGDAKAPQAATPPRMPDVVPWTEAERLAKEKEVVGFFISGHPLERFREEAHLLGTRTTATLGTWSEHRVTAAIVVTAVKRRISKKTGAEYARLTLEDFHGTAEALVFPDTWSKLSEVIVPDAALLLTGGHSPRDRGEDRAPFIVDDAQPLAGLRESGSIGVALEWRAGGGPDGDAARALNALCAAHPGPAPVFVEWSDGNGVTAHLRARGAQVALDEDFLGALRELVGTERVRLVRAQ